MAQEQQFSVPGGTLIKDATGTYRFVPGGAQENGLSGPTLPLASTTPPSTEPSNATGKDFLQMGLQGLTLAAGFVPGGQPISIAGKALGTLPYAVPAAAAAGALEGAVDPNQSAAGGATFQALLEGGSRGASRALPWMANRAGLAIGGLPKSMRTQAGEISDAFMRQKDRLTPSNPFTYIMNILKGNPSASTGLPIGAQNTTRKLMDEVGSKIEDFGTSRPERVDLFDLSGSTDELNADAINFPGVGKVRRELGTGETNEILDQVNQRWIDNGRPAGPIDTTVSFRDSQKLRAGYGAHAQKAFERANTPGFDSVAEETSSKMWAAMNQRIRELQERALQGDPDALHTIKQLNAEFSDLATMHKANSGLRGGGGLGEIGQISVRGGLGAGLGAGTASLTGGDYRTGGALGGIYAILGLNPRALSMQGNIAGDVARAAPTITRAADMVNEDKPPRRRTPGGRR